MKSITDVLFQKGMINLLIQSRFKSRLFDLHIFFAFFLGSKFLIYLRGQFRVRKIFSCTQTSFVHKFLWDLQSFHFVSKITISKMLNLCSRLPFH